MILYSLDTRWNFGQITEWDVVKETPKTYMVLRKGETINVFNREVAIRKETMRIFDYVFFFSRAEAVEEYRKRLVSKIEKCKDNIEKSKKEIADYEERLRNLEKRSES